MLLANRTELKESSISLATFFLQSASKLGVDAHGNKKPTKSLRIRSRIS